jgi:hypothetical protein
MSRALIVSAALLAACAAPGGPAPSQAPAARPAAVAGVALPTVQNPGFEEPGVEACVARWQCSAHVSVASFRFFVANDVPATGRGSLCIERTGNEPWALVTQGFHTTALRGQRVRLSMAVRAQSLEGGAGPWIQSQGGRAHAMKLVKATNGWERVAVDLAVPTESNLVVVGATLEGPGRACFDDVRLELL